MQTVVLNKCCLLISLIVFLRFSLSRECYTILWHYLFRFILKLIKNAIITDLVLILASSCKQWKNIIIECQFDKHPNNHVLLYEYRFNCMYEVLDWHVSQGQSQKFQFGEVSIQNKINLEEPKWKKLKFYNNFTIFYI